MHLHAKNRHYLYAKWAVGILLAAAALLFSEQVRSQQQSLPPDGHALAAAKRCVSCHKVDKKVVGPAFKAIASRFAGQATAQTYLAESILRGSRGRWGPVPMPKQDHVSADDARLLAAWILSLEP